MILDERISACFEAVYSFNMPRADSLASVFFKPSSVEHSLVAVNILWWNMISGSSPKEAYQKISDIFSRLLSENPSKTTDSKRLIQIVSTGIIKFRADAVAGNKTTAMLTAMKVLPYYKRILEDESFCLDFHFLVGVYNYMVGVLRSEKSVFFPAFVFLPSSDIQKGLSILESLTSSESAMLFYESNYLLYKVEDEILKDKKASYIRVTRLANRFPENPIIELERLKGMVVFDPEVERDIVRFQNIVLNSLNLNNQQKSHLLEVSRLLKKI